MRIQEWLAVNGLPAEATFDVGLLPNEAMGAVVRETHVALFPSRCEGGTNLVAVEAMASGVPTILSANTGHRDLIADDHAYALTDQRAVRAPKPSVCVHEALEGLERAYSDTDDSQARGAAAAAFMQDWTWETQTARLLHVVSDIL